MAVKVKPKEKPIILEPEVPAEFEGFEEESEGFQVISNTPAIELPKNIRADKDHLFWDWLGSLEEKDFNHLLFYVYREWPIIDRQRINPKAVINIDTIGTHFTKDEITKRHGSGKYKLLAIDSNKQINGKGGQVATVRFEINDSEHPPKFVLEELVPEHPSNKSIVDTLVAEGKLNIEGKVMAIAQGGNDNTALIALLTRMIEKQGNQPVVAKDTTTDNIGQMYVKASDNMMAMLREQLKGDDPEKWIKIATLILPLLQKPDNSAGLMETMLKIQADAQARESALMVKMMELVSAKPDSSDAEDKILGRIATYKELFGGGESGHSAKKSTLEVVLEHGGPIALKLGGIIENLLSMKNYQAGMQKQAMQQQPIPQQQTIDAPPQTNQEQPITEGENVVEMPKQENELITLIKGPAGPLILGALTRGDTGDVFAESLEGMFGKLTYDKIAAVGKDGILASMQAVPEFWNNVVPSSIEKFVGEFISYGQDDEPAE